MKRTLLLLAIFISSVSFVKAEPPSIGDDSFFTCIETENEFDPGFCYGDISWVTDKNGDDKGGEVVAKLKKSRKILRKAAKFFKKQKNLYQIRNNTLNFEFNCQIIAVTQQLLKMIKF